MVQYTQKLRTLKIIGDIEIAWSDLDGEPVNQKAQGQGEIHV